MATPPDQRIVILTGAGISKESGLDTFRDADGIWTKVNLEDVATPEGFARDPAGVQEFYNARRDSLVRGNVRPNTAHAALARLEADWPADVLIVTQNIDNLHEAAGSRNLIHMHGELLKVREADSLHCYRRDPALGTGAGREPDGQPPAIEITAQDVDCVAA